MMAESQSSSASTIPYELTVNTDPEFIDELEIVNELFFGHAEVPDVECASESDSDTDRETGADDESDRNLDVEGIKEDHFFRNGCGCSRMHDPDGKSCTPVFSKEEVINYRLSMLEKTKAELDLIIKAQLYHLKEHGESTAKGKERQRPRQRYMFVGKTVCREFFAFAHGVCRKTVDAISRSINLVGMQERVHGNKNVVPKHALSMDEVSHVKSFIETYATTNGVHPPGRMPGCRYIRNVLLPSDKNKSDIYNFYCEAADLSVIRKVALKTFLRLWQEHCPNIIIMKPATDLCSVCQKHATKILHSGNWTEEEKQQELQDYGTHITKVQCQRDHYRKICETSKQSFESLSAENKVRGQTPCSVDTQAVYSFDYAQQVLYPHYAQQVGPMFFRTPRNCQCFGVCCESSGTHIFYLVDEAEGAGKGANGVTSMLHHHFQNLGYGEQHATLNIDNCSGQSKNNTVIGYGVWRTMTGAHQSVEFCLMEAGHTKFSPDWHF